jgi:nucleotide-binding universal stress UspA family protein
MATESPEVRLTPSTILVAVDVPEGMEELLGAASELAAQSGARIHIVHAFDTEGAGGDPLQEEQRDREMLRLAVAEAFPGDVVPTEIHTFRGKPAEIILREAERIQADAIILGPHRSRGRGDRILGGTAESILRHATMPCLVLNAPLGFPLRRIMVPTDFSVPARRAFRAALAWGDAIQERTTVALVHVAGAATLVSDDKDLESDLSMEAGNLSEGAIAPTETRLLRAPDDPAGALIDFAVQDGAGMIAIGTSGAGALTRVFLGSMSSEVLRRANLPLLLVPPPIEDRPR